MTAQEFADRFVNALNATRQMMREEPVGMEYLQRMGMKVVKCECEDPTCPGWAMAVPDRNNVPDSAPNKYPEGKLNPQDEGELNLVIGHKNNRVIIHFGKQVIWIGLPPAQARNMASGLLHYAAIVEGTVAAPGSEAVN